MRIVDFIFILITLIISLTISTDTLALSPPDTLIIAGPSGTLNTRDFAFYWTGRTATPDSYIKGFYYRLDAESWNWTQDRVMTYYDIPDGSHRLEVKAVDNNNAEDPSPASRTFTVQQNFAAEPNEVPFGVQREFQSQLDSGIISEGLRQEFSNNGRPISQNAAVSTVVQASKWLITDGNNSYKVRKEGNKLNIYQDDLLFRLDSAFQADLDAGNVTANLRNEFEENNVSLSQNATISTIVQSTEWLIDGKHTVRKEKGRLNVYQDELQFSVELFQHIANYLDSRIISDGLRQEFRSNGITLSQSATVSVEDQGKKWLIADTVVNKVYIVIKDSSKNKLNIYESVNDNASEALSLTPGTSIRCASFADSDDASGVDEDWFRFTNEPELNKNRQITIFFKRPNAVGSTVIKVYRYPEVSEGKEIARFTAGYRAFFATGVHTGEYLVRISYAVTPAYAGADAVYFLTVTMDDLSPGIIWERERNDRSSDATEIPSTVLSRGSQWVEMVGNKSSGSDNKDYFKIHVDIAQPARLSLNLTRPQSGTTTVKLLPADLISSEVGRFQVSPNIAPQWKLETGVKLGDYILEVELPTEQDPDYLYFLTLQISDLPAGEVWELEPNDSPGLANRLPIGARFRATKGHPGDTKDWFRLTVPYKGILNLTTSRILKAGALNLYLLDPVLLNPVGGPLAFQVQEQRQRDFLNMDILSGDYLVEVDLTKVPGDYWLAAQLITSVEHDAPADAPLTIGKTLNVKLAWEPGNTAAFDIFELMTDGTHKDEPLNISPIIMYDDGLHSDGKSNDGIYAAPYVIKIENQTPAYAGAKITNFVVVVHIQDRLGNTADFPIPRKIAIDTTPPDTTPPEIRKVSHDATTGILRTGQQLTVTIEGEAGSTATFDIGELVKGVPAYDDGRHNDGAAKDGKYVGKYIIKAEDYVSEAGVTGYLTDEAGNIASLDAPILINVFGNRPAISSVEHTGRLTLGSGDTLRVTLIGDPDCIASFDIEGLVNNIPMYDDGRHDDGNSGDGKYVGSYKVAPGDGVISAPVTARLIDRGSRKSSKTAHVKVSVDAVPPAPVVGVKAYDRPDDQGRFITLSWNASAEMDFAHYNIYVSKNPFTPESPAYARAEITDPARTSLDIEVEADLVDYFFAVTAVDIMRNESILSSASVAGPVRSLDNLRPVPVKTVKAVDRAQDFGGVIILSWTDVNQDKDFARYNIYQETKPVISTAGLKPVDSISDRYMTVVDIITDHGSRITDHGSRITDHEYYFAVTAVDLSGNESELDKAGGSVAGPVRAENNIGSEPDGPVKFLAGPVGTIHHDHVAFHFSRYLTTNTSIGYPASSISYTIQGYYYRLDDENWRWTTDSSVVYYGLIPGPHTFSVRPGGFLPAVPQASLPVNVQAAVSRSFTVVPVSTSEQEPNDSQNTAYAIRPGVIVKGESSNNNDSDWFRVHLPDIPAYAGPGVMDVFFSRAAGVGSTKVSIYSVQPFQEVGYFESNDSQPRHLTLGTAGSYTGSDYFIHVAPAYAGAVNVDQSAYKLIVTNDGLPQGFLWEVEDNNRGSAANILANLSADVPIYKSIEVRGSSRGNQDLDYFKVHISDTSESPVWMNISFYRPNAETLTTVELYSSSPDVKERQIGLLSVDALDTTPVYFTGVVRRGSDYFIKVNNGAGSAFGDYYFLLSLSEQPTDKSVAYEVEPNNQSAYANPLSVGVKQNGTNWDGNKDDDWYILDIKSTGPAGSQVSGLKSQVLSLSFSRPAGIGTTLVELYNSALINIGKLQVDVISAQRNSINLSVQPGTYYVRVHPQSESPSAEYGLTATLIDSISLSLLSAGGDKISHEDRPLRVGDKVQLSLRFPSHASKVTFDVGNIRIGLPMLDQGNDVYKGTYIVNAGDNQDNAPIIVHLLDPYGSITDIELDESVSVDTAPPNIKEVSHNGVTPFSAGKKLTLRMVGEPRCSAIFDITGFKAGLDMYSMTSDIADPPLVILNWDWRVLDPESSIVVIGRVKNISDSVKDRVKLIVTFFDAAGKAIPPYSGTSDFAFAIPRDIPPGVAASFKIYSKYTGKEDGARLKLVYGASEKAVGESADDGAYFGSYQVGDNDNIKDATITCYLTDAAGNSTIARAAEKVTFDTIPPVIKSLTHDADRVLVEGDVLTVTMEVEGGEPGGTATFDIGSFRKEEMRSSDPVGSKYVGIYRVKAGDEVTSALITGYLKDAAGNSASYVSTRSVSISTAAPRITAVTHNAGAERLGKPLIQGETLIVTAHTDPGVAATYEIVGLVQGRPMYDDGAHGDGAPGDGVYKGSYTIRKGDNVKNGKVKVMVISPNGKASLREALETVSVDTTPPSAVTGVRAIDRPDDEGGYIILSWAPSPAYTGTEDFHHYNIYQSQQPIISLSGLKPLDADIIEADCSLMDVRCSTVQITVSSIQNFYFAVTADDIATNESPITRESTAGPVSAVDNLPPPPVQKVTGYDRAYDNGKVISIVWSDPSLAEDFQRYHIYMSTAPITSTAVLAPVDAGITDRNVCIADIPVPQDRMGFFFAVTAVDFSGNESQITKDSVTGPIFSQDNLGAPPDTLVRIISGPVGEIHYDDVTFRWARWLSDTLQLPAAVSGYYYKLDNSNWAWTNEAEKTYYDLKEGQHTFYVRADLGVGTTDPMPTTRIFAVKRIVISEIEPNDTSNRANWISKGMTVSGASATDSDDDWYQFHVEFDGLMTLNVVRINGTGTTTINVFKSFPPVQEAKIGTIIVNPSSQRRSFSTGVELGDYFVQVDSQGENPEAKYEISVTASEMPENVQWDRENNDQPGMAQLLILNERSASASIPAYAGMEVSGLGNKPGDVDWYQLRVSPAGSYLMVIDFVRPQGIGSTEMSIYASFPATESPKIGLITLVPTNNQKQRLSISIKPGDYFLKVDNSGENPTGISSIYSFRIFLTPTSEKWELEPNGILQYANSLLINEVIKGTSWHPNDDLDWYRVRLDNRGIFVLSYFKPFGMGSAEIKLRDASGTDLAQAQASALTGQKAAISATLNMGDYFVVVDPANEVDASADYRLVTTMLESVKLETQVSSLRSPVSSLKPPLSAGDTIKLTAVWTPGNFLSFDIGRLRSELPIYDDGAHDDRNANDGVYVGSYTVKAGDDVSSAEVILHLVMPPVSGLQFPVSSLQSWKADLKLEDKITIDTTPPTIFRVDHDMKLRPLAAGESLKVTMTGETGAREAFFDIVLAITDGKAPSPRHSRILMKEGPAGTYSGSYTVEEIDNLKDALVICHLIDVAGNESQKAAEIPISFDTTRPEIIKISHDASKILIEGDVLTVTVNSDTIKGKATFSMGNLVKDRSMYDDATHGDKVADDGIYTGQYTVQKGDNVTDAIVSVRLVDEAGNATERNAFEPVTIDTTPPKIISLVHDATSILSAGDVLTVTLKGDPGNIATFDIGDFPAFRSGLPMYDDGTRFDKTPGDGIYVGTYTVIKADNAKDMRITGYLTDKNGNQTASRVFERVSIDAVPPLPVVGVKAVDKPDDEGFWIILSWEAVNLSDPRVRGDEDFDHYNIYRESAPITSVLGLTPLADTSTITTIVSKDVSRESLEVIVPTNRVNYYLAVTASDRAGNESALDKVNGVAGPVQALDNIAPEPVTVVSAVDRPDDQGKDIIVSWTKASTAMDFDHYGIYLSDKPIASVNGLKPLLTQEVKAGDVMDLPGLGVYLPVPSNGVDFYVAVTAFDKNGNESPLDAEGGSVAGPVRSTDDIPPEPVILVAVSDTPYDEGGSLDVLWQKQPQGKDEEVHHYNFYLSKEPIDNDILPTLEPVAVVDASTITPAYAGAQVSSLKSQVSSPADLVSFYVAVTAEDFGGNISVLDKTGRSMAGPVQSVSNTIKAKANTTIFAGFDPNTSVFIPAGAMGDQETVDVFWPDEAIQQRIEEANQFLDISHIDPQIDSYFADTVREFRASTANIRNPVTITLSYPDLDELRDMLERNVSEPATLAYAGAQDVVKQLRIFRLNQVSRIPKWELVSGLQQANTQQKTLAAEVRELGVFRVACLKLPENLDKVVVYPNPFIPSQSINGYITFKNLTENATIEIYDMAGKRVRTIEPRRGGGDEAVWDACNYKGEEVTSGTYVFVIRSDAGAIKPKVGKLVILR